MRLPTKELCAQDGPCQKEAIMPTDIVLVLRRKAEKEAQASKRRVTDLTIVCFWSVLGLVLAMLMIRMGFDADLAWDSVMVG